MILRVSSNQSDSLILFHDSPEHLREERLLLMPLSFQPEVGEAAPAAAETWQDSSVGSAAGIYCNPVKPATWPDPSSPAVSPCVFPYLQRSSLLEKSEIPESIPPVSSPQLQPPSKVSVRCSGFFRAVLPFAPCQQVYV